MTGGSDAALDEVGAGLESAVQTALQALEQHGVSAREADEFIRDCVFTAWWNWDYEPAKPEKSGA